MKKIIALAALFAVAVLSGQSVHAESKPTEQTMVCGQGDELFTHLPDQVNKAYVIVNGVRYDYVNMYAPRVSSNAAAIMVEFATNDAHSVFLVADEGIAINYEGRSETCKDVK